MYPGCTDVNAFNYDADANQDDGSCEDILAGCLDTLFTEYDVNANTQSFDSEGNNIYCVTPVVYGCTSLDSLEYWDYDAANYTIDYFVTDSIPNVDDGSCSEPVIFGCADPTFIEYWYMMHLVFLFLVLIQ